MLHRDRRVSGGVIFLLDAVSQGLHGRSERVSQSRSLSLRVPAPMILTRTSLVHGPPQLLELALTVWYDIKDKVKTAKDFWVQLPYTVCNDDEVAASPDSDDDCWNGQDRARYNPEVQKDGLLTK
ncbi:hypothetical protein C0Q70_21522 [Pomacea canaliculata]|uniref:Uncharacterized protein n=1 Tax=Pomacea canaliculata TaxID=400727 RepID=A0A2T7NCR5_POMCA|nr:hypothetical protein C0Q70_21522 [Pomacea canaliculata]